MSLVAHPRSNATVYQAAIAALRAGISIIPIHADGTKRPAVAWKVYQNKRPTLAEVKWWYRNASYGIAFITGCISGGLELLDFDDHEIYEAWAERMREEGLASLLERIERGYKEESPGSGMHLFYRCSAIEGNQKLARRPVSGSQKAESLIETRGEGGYSIVAPSDGKVHPSGKPYLLMRGGAATIATITPQERQSLLSLARTFDEMPPSEALSLKVSERHDQEHNGRRPGDIFNERVSWEELLPRYGWELVRYVGKEGQWKRPGKEGDGISATTNYAHSDLLYVFSTSTCFEPERGYSKFSAYALLEHGGDFSAAAKALVEQGYVDKKENVEATFRS